MYVLGTMNSLRMPFWMVPDSCSCETRCSSAASTPRVSQTIAPTTNTAQTVSADHHPRFHQLLVAFHQLTGCPAVVNTSFNVRGEPIVCTPEDAYRCFMRTDMDVLVVGNHILRKPEQPEWAEEEDWRETFALD